MNILGIIPARGGSKGVKRKNIKNLSGKPLIYYTIREAKKSKFLTKIVVSTEDSEIKKISKKYGIQVISRPKLLSKDTTPSEPVFIHAMNFLERKEGFHTDILVILQPTSPLRNFRDIDQSIKKFLSKNCNSVVSVTIANHPPYWMYTLDRDKIKPIIKGKRITRRQDSPKFYQLNGAVYVTSGKFVREKNTVLGKNVCAYIMPNERSVDIDTELDFKLAELLIKKNESYKRKI